MGPTPCQFDKWRCQAFINVKKKKKKIVFRIRKEYLRIVFLMPIQGLNYIFRSDL